MADSKQSYPASLLLVILLISFYELEENIVFPPLIRLLEDAICRQHYAKSVPPTSVVDESMCKTVKIQSDLAFVRGWFGLFKTAPGIYRFVHLIWIAKFLAQQSFLVRSSATSRIDSGVVLYMHFPC